MWERKCVNSSKCFLGRVYKCVAIGSEKLRQIGTEFGKNDMIVQKRMTEEIIFPW